MSKGARPGEVLVDEADPESFTRMVDQMIANASRVDEIRVATVWALGNSAEEIVRNCERLQSAGLTVVLAPKTGRAKPKRGGR